jgi:hypothetical protein
LVRGCQYELHEQVILEKLANLDNVAIIVDEKEWFKNPKTDAEKARHDVTHYWYPRIGRKIFRGKECGIRVFSYPDRYVSMHEKWLANKNSLVFGSFNASENAKRNIESIIVMNDVPPEHRRFMVRNYEWLRSRSIPWSLYLKGCEYAD